MRTFASSSGVRERGTRDLAVVCNAHRMATVRRRHPEGVPGDWYIDDRCIGCGASFSIAPQLIVPTADGRQFVFRAQPLDDAQLKLAQLAAEVCPTASIGTVSRLRWARHHPVEVASGVWRCGSNSPDTAGGNSYLVERREGHVLIDAPRYTRRVSRHIEGRGGLALIALTHRDDVGDAQRYARQFEADVLIHRADAVAAPFATRILEGSEAIEVQAGLLAIPTPGHTAGHTMFLLDGETLFSGDSLSWDPDRADLWAEKLVCWHSWPEQLASLEQLANHRFVRVIPTHGALSPTLPYAEMRERLRDLIGLLRQQDGR
jgi:glyoxylase-like metal-dependent hydrolase (beta-lactamase superfamily II)/ferredoxin